MTNFLKPFVDNHLLKFIGMESKYNLDYVKAFYCNLELITALFESRFKKKVVKFDYSDYNKYLGLSYDGSNMFVSKSSDYDKISFLLSISKSVCENMEMSNFGISQLKFCMHLLHWIVV